MDDYWTAECPFPPSENDYARYDKMALLRDVLMPQGVRLPERRYELVMTFYGRWDGPDGKPLKRDLPNYDKYLIDAIRDAVGLDDRWFRPIHLYAVHVDGEERVEITLTPANETHPSGC